MKPLLAWVLLATLVGSAVLTFATERKLALDDGSFVIAQRQCPRNQC